jgi:SAM-dependent methyltransferase
MEASEMTQEAVQAEVQQQAGKLLTQVAGLVGTRTIEMGLRHGLIAAAAKHPEGISAEQLASAAGMNAFYVDVWCRAAFAAEVLESDDGTTYRLAPHMDRLLLERDFPGWVGGIFNVMIQPELFDAFSASLESGKRTWWDQVSPDFIAAVAGTSHPFYSRLLASGVARVPGLAERLDEGAHVLELACGTGSGLTRMAHAYPKSSFVAHDGDAYSLELAGGSFRGAGVHDRVSLLHRTIEDLGQENEYDVALINVSMHECRDIEQATASIHRALKPGGTFVISDFPFPESHEGLRTPPARVMGGIQFFEAQIDDQLLPTSAYVELLGRHGFADVASFDLSPVHVVVHGRK